MQKKLFANQYRATLVCIDTYENNILCGRLYNPSLSGGESFRSAMQFIHGMDKILNGMDFPQPFMETRSFSDVCGSSAIPAAKTEMHNGKLATFTIRVIFRRNASWQGSVSWLEGSREQNFRSVLELLLLMDGVLTAESKKT